jgi:hypothetical protein
MTDVLLSLVLIGIFMLGLQTTHIWKKLNSGEEQRKLEENVQRAMDRMAQQVFENNEKENARNGGSLDEGFENIMTYHVGLGRGKTSEGEPWNV